MYMEIKQDRLEGVSIEVTTKCNLNCTHCFALAGISNKENLHWNKAVDIAAEGFSLGFRLLHITGGEPFLWKHIFQLISYALDLGYTQIIINTNATLLSDEICRKLSDYNEKIALTCSINGDESIHESVRGAGTYQKTYNGIENALKYNINVNIYTTVEKKLLPVLPVFVETLFRNFSGLKNLFLIQLRKSVDVQSSVFKKMLSPDDFIKLVQIAGLLSLKGYPVNILENPLSNVVANYLNMNWFPQSPAITRYGKIIVLSNGNITANHSSRISYGYYSDGMLAKVLRSEQYRNDVHSNSTMCPSCEFFSVCRANGMVHSSSTEHNNSQDENLFCRKVLQICENIKSM